MTKQQKQLKNFLESLLLNYGNAKNPLSKKKQYHLFTQKDEYSPGFYLVQNHLRRASKRNMNNDRVVPIEMTTLNEYNLKTGDNLEDVKIHYGAYSDELTRAYHATALTIGATIYFSTKAYKPETEEGRKTLVHELTHIRQNKEDILEGQKTTEELEMEAERTEKIEEHNTERYREITFEGEKYRLSEKEYRKIMDEIRNEVEQQLDHNTMDLSQTEYLKALIRYQELEQRSELIWQK